MTAVAVLGCAFAPAVYNSTGMEQSDLAYVQTKRDSGWDAQIMAVFDENGNRVIGTSSSVEQDRWLEVRLQPGKYQMAVYCYSGNLTATPRINTELELKGRYTLRCRGIKGKAMLGIEMVTKAEAVLDRITTS